MERLTRVQKSYAFRYPHRLYEQKLEQVDKLTENLIRGTSRLSMLKKGQLDALNKQLIRNHPREALQVAEERYNRTQKDLNRTMLQIISKKGQNSTGSFLR